MLPVILIPLFYLLAVGHMSIRKEADSEWTTIVKAIRQVHPTTPITIFGGHHHVRLTPLFSSLRPAEPSVDLQIRDCVREDSHSMSLAAGRYMETVGWMSERKVPLYSSIYRR